MLAKGIIQSIDYTSNTCVVRVPLFETAGNQYKNENEAIFAIPPGVFNGYKVDDVVIVGFDAGNDGDPIVIGKLYIDAATEAKLTNGAIHCSELVVDSSATLPADVKISFSKDESKTSNDEVELNSFNSLSDITKAITKNSSKINSLTTNVSDTERYSIVDELAIGTWVDGKSIYRRVFYVSSIDELSSTTISTSINDINTITKIYGVAKPSDASTISVPIPDISILTANIDTKTSNLLLNAVISVKDIYIIIEYTKNS